MPNGTVVLELTWEKPLIEVQCGNDSFGEIGRSFVGWVGGVSNQNHAGGIEMSIESAKSMGIKEAIDNNPNLRISARVWDNVPIAERIDVEPCTPDDWEILELNAEYLESEILRQVTVVNQGQCIPLWIHHHTLVHVWISLSSGELFARLGTDTEIVVAPKLRKPVQSDVVDTADAYFYRASPTLYVQPLRVNVQKSDETFPFSNEIVINPRFDEVLVHPSTLFEADGFKQLGRNFNSKSIFVSLWSDEKINAGEYKFMVTGHGIKRPRPTAVARLCCSDSISPGYIGVGFAIMDALKILNLSRVQFRMLKKPSLVPQSWHLQITSDLGYLFESETEDKQKQQEMSSKVVMDSFNTWLNNQFRNYNTEVPFVMKNGCAVDIPIDVAGYIDKRINVEFSLKFHDGEISEEKQIIENEAGSCLSSAELIGVDEKYAVVNREFFTDCHRLVQQDSPRSIRNEDTTDSNLILSSLYNDSKIDADVSVPQVGTGIKCLGGLFPWLQEEIVPIFWPLLSQSASLCRVVLGTPAGGSCLITGARGMGKSAILRQLCEELSLTQEVMSYPIYVCCRNWLGLKLNQIKDQLNDIYETASRHAPAVVALDDLDAIMPKISEDEAPANEQSMRLAEHLKQIILSHQIEVNEYSSELAAYISCSASTTSSTKSDSVLSHDDCFQSLYGFLKRTSRSRNVVTIASAKSAENIHISLRSCGVFDAPVQLPVMNGIAREEILMKLLAIEPHQGADWLSDVSQQTEGFSQRDLVQLVHRARHTQKIRVTKQFESQQISDEDMKKALKDFVPTALRNVKLFKSDVKWSDVGGLQSVRSALRDTLELPTRYAKLYLASPIKLPAGLLLYGPPGCGKTLLAGAVANECGLNFISVKGPEVLNKYIGASEEAVRDLFARASEASPCVLFLDEFDSIAPRRGADNTGVTDRVVNQLLTFLDGVEDRKGVYVLAATSRPDMIDPALLRPGRLDKSLYCGFPNEEERLDILMAISKSMNLSSDAVSYLPTVACSQKGSFFTGADLQAILYSAQLEAVHQILPSNINRTEDSSDTSDRDASVPQITRIHIEKVLEDTRPSVSISERRRFEDLYSKFCGSRTTDFTPASCDNTITEQRTALF